MVKKGKLEEIFSKARFADDPFTYKVFYRDFANLREMSLPEFIEESENFETIPITRIELIKKNNKTLFRKSKI
jgi:S-adenosylmethionine:diacylglycerol 3-amino-3-carboxypropyl transferase